MRPGTILAVAIAEMRSARRLARTWIFAVLSLLVASIAFGYFSVIHGMASGYSATAGFVGPASSSARWAFICCGSCSWA